MIDTRYVQKPGDDVDPSGGFSSHPARYLLPVLLVLVCGLAWATAVHMSHLPRVDASGQAVRFVWWRLSSSDWLGVALVVASASSLALLTWFLRFAVNKISSDGWYLLAMGAAVLVWFAGAAVAAGIALLGYLSYAAGTETLVQGPHGVRRLVTQGASGDSANVYRPVNSHLYVYETGVRNGVNLSSGEGRCTISEDQASRLVLHCGNTVTTLS